jgi:hypothetical protein
VPTPSDGYYIDGRRVPSVTTIIGTGLGGFSKDALMAWAWREGKEGRDYKQTSQKAADIGTVAHAMIECFLNGSLYIPTLEHEPLVPEAQPCFDAFQEWHSTHDIVIHEQEIRLTSSRHKFGGTFDALGTLDGVPALFDWKSSKGLYGSYAVQISAYYMLITENRPQSDWPRTVAIVRVGKDGKLNVAQIDRKDLAMPWDVFLHAKAIYQARYELDKLIKPAAIQIVREVPTLPTVAAEEVKIA